MNRGGNSVGSLESSMQDPGLKIAGRGTKMLKYRGDLTNEYLHDNGRHQKCEFIMYKKRHWEFVCVCVCGEG